MALSRQNLRHIAYLLEVAPITSSPATQCRANFCAQSRLKRRNDSRREFRVSSAQHSAARKVRDTPNGRPSAARTLLSDNEAVKTATTRPSNTPSTSSTPSDAGLTASASAALDRLSRVLEDAKQPLHVDKAIAEEDALKSIRLCKDLAKAFKEGGGHGGQAAASPVTGLLFPSEQGREASGIRDVAVEMMAIKKAAIQKIVETARAIVTDPKVFITQQILESYVQLRTSTGHPEDLANVFQLYATKLIPEPNTSPVKYSAPSPDKASFAIPLETAQYALKAAIATRNLPLCFDIIKNSVTTTAFQRRKLIQKALLPFAGVATAPFAAYALASQFAVFQENLNTSTARMVGFVGIMSYIAFTGTIGMVAVTTANDQMDRVVWQDGTPLRERWLREEERAMFDQVAVAWGFKDPYRKGEEEGPDWEALKELISLRGMILDKIELMEGMQ